MEIQGYFGRPMELVCYCLMMFSSTCIHIYDDEILWRHKENVCLCIFHGILINVFMSYISHVVYDDHIING